MLRCKRELHRLSPTQTLTSQIYLLLLVAVCSVHCQLVFLGQEPFTAYMSLATLPRQTVYQFFAADSSTGEASGIEYTLTRNVVLPGGDVLFIVDASTGAMFLNNAGGLSLEQYNLTVEARKSNSDFITARITVNVIRESDTAPRFEHESYRLSISESLQIGRPFSVIRGFSLYSNNTTPQRYTIVGGNNDRQFTIGSSNGVLRISQSLDRETTSTYMLTVRYVDELTTIDVPIEVEVSDENDNSPVFELSLYNVSIPETLPPHGFILEVHATDQDAGENGTVFYLLEENIRDTFSLNSSSGRLTTLTQLDYERQAQYQFTVTASDTGNPPQLSVVTVLLRLINFDDECPRFENPVFIAELPYDPDAGMVPNVNMVVVSVMATDPDRLSNVTYSIVSSTDVESILSLSNTTGDITLTRVDPNLRGQYTLNVTASDANCRGQSFARVEVNIGNVNDHSPVLGECVANLSENPPNGTEVIRLVATDEDIGFNGLVTYSLLTNTELFSIDALSGVVRTIASPARYDRENQSFLSIGVIASDGGNRQDYCQLTINIIDENDNAPAFTLSSYNTSVSNNAPLGTFVVQVQASDRDSGANGELSYSINSSSLAHTFTINRFTGIITTNTTSLSQNEYIFDVIATDMAPMNSQLSSRAIVNVTVVDGSSFPVFEQTNYSASICENSPFRTSVLEVLATSDPPDFIIYEIVSGNMYHSNRDDAFVIVPDSDSTRGATIEVGSSVVIDFEQLVPSSSFMFFVRASNSAGSSLTSVEIFVIDVDDSRPQFVMDFSITIPERYPVGAPVGLLEAVDADSGTNGEIAFRVSDVTNNPGREYFSVAWNGTIIAMHEFDFENESELHGGDGAVLNVEAYNPNPPEDSECVSVPRERDRVPYRIRWSITDFNDNPPFFIDASYSERLREDFPTQTSFLELNASDPDIIDANSLSFSIVSGNIGGNFGIQSNQLVLSQRLDFETVQSYTLMIQVTDGVHIGSTCPICVATVSIQVLDVDDEPPSFTEDVYRGEVVENAALNTTVLYLNASDPDSTFITYELRGQAEGRFTVDHTGRISVSGPIDREEFPGGEIVFLAFAEGGSLATVDVVIRIADINDYVPRFADEFSGRVQENTLPGENGLYVTEVHAVDLDDMENGTVTYTLLSGEESGFRIDNSSGLITAHVQFDREAQPTYTLIVQATDNGFALQLSSTSRVLVTIGDDNDNKPFFPFPYMYARVFENAAQGHVVTTVPGLDLDNGTNASITYTLVSSSSNEVKFSLDSSSGVVSVVGSLDYEIPRHRSFNLTLSLSDPLYRSEENGTLTIDVLDQNDNAPTILGLEYLIQRSNNIAETFPAGNELARVRASDPDSGTNSELQFAISEGDENGDFEISVEDGVLGNIRNKRQFDRETTPVYNLIVTVSDKGQPPQSSIVNVDFNVNDANDEPPGFSQAKYAVSILENTDPNPSLLHVQATDPDTGNGGEISMYAITAGNKEDRFSIDAISGVISSNVVFDREETAFYTLTIIAIDGGVNPNTGTATVQISILDVNDNPTLRGGELTILVYALDGLVTPQPIGPINFNDADINDTFISCIFTFTNTDSDFFLVRDVDCILVLDRPNPLPEVYRYEVLGTDGSSPSTTANLTVVVEDIPRSQIPLEHTVTLTLNASVSDYFKKQLNITFRSLLAQTLDVPVSLLHIFSVQPGYFDPDGTVDIFFTARMSSRGAFLSRDFIINRLVLQLESLSVLGHSIISLPVDPCSAEPCFNQAACRTNLTLLPTQITSNSREHILLSPRVDLGYTCDCVIGTSGKRCEINFDDCYSNPCLFDAQCHDQVNGFTCDCPEGTSGDDCSFNPNECTVDPCLNGATCVNGFGLYVCECLPGYYGNECQYHSFRPSTVCLSNPCQNGGECSSGRDGFTCLCPQGFTGEFCEQLSTAQGGCTNNPCYNGSTCTDTPQGAVCSCSVGFTGPKCRWPLNNCELEPCENGGTCDAGVYGAYQCICPPGYTGANCSSRIPPCSLLPCQNGGRCSNGEDSSYSCECPRQFTGQNCETSLFPQDLCDTTLSPCSNNATCTSGRDNFTCRCDSEHAGLDCLVEVNDQTSLDQSPCYSNPCLFGGYCSPSADGLSYMCACPGGFTGSNCEVDIDDCTNNLCMNGAVCIDGIEGYFCDCPPQITGEHCQIFCPQGRGGDFCEEVVPLCTEDVCSNGTCQEQPGGLFTCVCLPGFTGERCELLNNCDTIECLNGGTCVAAIATADDPGCQCPPGFDGPHCEQLSVSFSGSASDPSYRTFGTLDLTGEGRIAFEFVTVATDGLLLYNTQYQDSGSDDFIAVEIMGGFLEVSVSHGGSGVTSAKVMSSSVRVSDGRWHQVEIESYGKSVRVSLDTCLLLGDELLMFADCSVAGQTSGDHSFLDLGLPLWLGGVPSEFPLPSLHQISSRGVTGCIRNVYINSRLLDLNSHMTQSNSQNGCGQIDDVCTASDELCGGGDCLPRWEEFQCVCPPQIEGESCDKDVQSVMFGGSTFAQYTLLPEGAETIRRRRQDSTGQLRSTLREELSLRFRTENENGLLFHLTGSDSIQDFVSVQLEGGFLVYHINLGSGEESVSMPTMQLNDAEWHTFSVERVALSLSLSLDNTNLTHNLSSTNLTLDIDATQVYAGGFPSAESDDVMANAYTGCLEDIRINRNILPTIGSNDFASVTFHGSGPILYNCALRGCSPDPCNDAASASCTEVGSSGYRCHCSDGSVTESSPCPLPVPPTMFRLVIVVVPIVGGVILCVLVTLLGMACYKAAQKRRLKYLVKQAAIASTNSRMEQEMFSRDYLVISNDPGGGEQDTAMTRTRWESRYAPQATQRNNDNNRNQSPKRHVKFDLSKTSYNSLEDVSVTEPESVSLIAVRESTSSPTIQAVLDERVMAANEEYRNLDAIREYEEEGACSEASSLSDICSGLEVEEYTVEHLMRAGPQFSQFIGLLESIAEEEEERNDSGDSEIAHTGMTQATPLTITQPTQMTAEFPYY